MPLQYDPTKDPYAFFTEGESLTEQEHAASCDINKMVRDAARGVAIRGQSSEPVYGYDDTTMDAVRFRIEKAAIEKNLAETFHQELDLPDEEISALEKTLESIPQKTREKFGMKLRPKQKTVEKNDAKTQNNDEKTSTQNKMASQNDPNPAMPSKTPNPPQDGR